jgi:hypothetical protein
MSTPNAPAVNTPGNNTPGNPPSPTPPGPTPSATPAGTPNPSLGDGGNGGTPTPVEPDPLPSIGGSSSGAGGQDTNTGGTAAAGGDNPGVAGSSAGTGGGNGEPVACTTPEEEDFSFFLISYEAIVRESGSPDGFGGDLGGIEGADALCQRVAEFSSPCAANKEWRAFLGTSSVDPIDRIGEGPWYDRIGRLFANNLEELANDRPANADAEIRDDLPNEYGVPNHNPDGSGEVDNHQTLTGTGIDGRVYTQSEDMGGGFGGTACPGGWTVEKATCWDWTSSEPEGCPRVGHSWPREGSGINWLSVWNEGGCAAGVVLEELGGPNGDPTVGSAGGYGGYYCFAVMGAE